MADDLLDGLRRFQSRYFPRYRRAYRQLIEQGQHPRTLFIGCSDSRIVPNLLTGSGPGELFIVRNVGNLIPPYDASHGYHGTTAAIEYAVQMLGVREIVVCGHSHCGAVQALYGDPLPHSPHMNRWLDLARDAVLPVVVSEDALRRTEQRSIALQLGRLLGYPMVAERVEKGELFLHGWYYVIEEGRVLILDVEKGVFVPTDLPPSGDDGDGGLAIHQLQ
jgi:carbonic anhydrase